MRRWLSRSLWLAAWSFWLWLGFGLYRELPRHWGPVLSTVLGEAEAPLGLIGGESLATFRLRPDGDSIVVRVRQIGSGALLREASVGFKNKSSFWFSSRLGIVVGEIPNHANSAVKLGALDLRTGRWTDLGVMNAQPKQVHANKPLVLLTQSNKNNDEPDVVVADLETGRHVFEWKATKSNDVERSLNGSPALLSDGDAILVPVGSKTVEPFSRRDSIEVWRMEKWPTGPERELQGASIGSEAVASPSGRIAWTDIGTSPTSVHVFDAKVGKIIFSHPPNARRLKEINYIGSVPQSTLSANGRRVMFEDVLWDVDQGTAVWKSNAMERVLLCDGRTTTVGESWDKLLGDWANGLSTWAIRDLGTWRVKYRVWKHGDVGPVPNEDRVDHARRFCVHNNGAVREHPPSANWPLLALCQTILALPLILLWAIMRWRRRRRLRHASVAA
jgi:hypothetical protein